jgi:hypothetical protein
VGHSHDKGLPHFLKSAQSVILEEMKRLTSLRTAAVPALLFLLTLGAHAQDKGYWRASSQTARSITGDVSLADEKIMINFYTTTMSQIRTLEAGEISAVFDADSTTHPTGSLYRLNIPAEKKFVHKNNLCGSEGVQWMVTYARGNAMQLAFFSGAKPPVFTLEAISNSTDLCGTFSYVR